MSKKSLWGDITDLSSMRSPYEILAEQGNFLEEMTKGVLNVKIERKQSGTVFAYDVFIALPTMKFKERLLRMSHDVKLYPAILHDAVESKQSNCSNQEEFEENLGRILSSPETMALVSGLLLQARSADDTLV